MAAPWAGKKAGWLKKISGLKKLLADVGPLWPDSTRLSGYGTDGPYSCQNCEYLRGRKEGNIFKDEDGMGRCNHPVVIADSEVKKDKSGIPIVGMNACCEFVEPPKEE